MIYTFEDENGEAVEIKSDKQPTEKDIRQAFLNKSIENERKATLQQENPTISALFPRGIETQAQDGGIGRTIGAGIGDTFSLAGRLIDSARDFEGATLKEKLDNYLKSVGETKGEGFLSEVLRHPATGAALTMAPVLGAAGLGTMTTAGVEGLGVAGVSQASRIGEGKDLSPSEAMIDIGASLAMPGFGQVFKRYTPQMKSMILKSAEGLNKVTKGLASELSGISSEALEIARTKRGREKLILMAGRSKQIGDKLLDKMDNIDQYYKYEDQLKTALNDMPEIDSDNVIKTLESEIKKLGNLPNELAAKGRLEGYLDGIKKDFTKTIETKEKIGTESGDFFTDWGSPVGKDIYKTTKKEVLGSIPALKFRDLRRRLDVSIDHNQEGADLFNNAMKKARHQAMVDLEEAGKGTPYAETINNYAEMLKARDRLYSKIGKRSDIREDRIESFTANLFGKNKTNRQDIVKDIDDIFGENFTEQIKLSTLADEIVKEGGIPYFASQTTGRSLKGELGSGVQAMIGASTGQPWMFGTAAGTLALSSPRFAPKMLNAIDATGRGLAQAPDIAKKIMTNPYLQQTIPGLARIQLRGE